MMSEQAVYGAVADSTKPRVKVRTHHLHKWKAEGHKWAMLTAYDYSTAAAFDERGSDDIETGLHGLAVQPLHVNQHVGRILRKRGQLAVDNRRHREHLLPRIDNQRVAFFAFQNVCILYALRVFLQYFLRRHRFVATERDEGWLMQRAAVEAERRFKWLQVVDADGRLAPPPPRRDVQFLLQLHQ